MEFFACLFGTSNIVLYSEHSAREKIHCKKIKHKKPPHPNFRTTGVRVLSYEMWWSRTPPHSGTKGLTGDCAACGPPGLFLRRLKFLGSTFPHLLSRRFHFTWFSWSRLDKQKKLSILLEHMLLNHLICQKLKNSAGREVGCRKRLRQLMALIQESGVFFDVSPPAGETYCFKNCFFIVKMLTDAIEQAGNDRGNLYGWEVAILITAGVTT